MNEYTYKIDLNNKYTFLGISSISLENGQLVINARYTDEIEPKDGDILVTPNETIFIYKYYDNEIAGCYCSYNSDLDIFLPESYKHFYAIKSCRYANKEQINSLHKKLNENYYAWVSSTKKLIKSK